MVVRLLDCNKLVDPDLSRCRSAGGLALSLCQRCQDFEREVLKAR